MSASVVHAVPRQRAPTINVDTSETVEAPAGVFVRPHNISSPSSASHISSSIPLTISHAKIHGTKFTARTAAQPRFALAKLNHHRPEVNTVTPAALNHIIDDPSKLSPHQDVELGWRLEENGTLFTTLHRVVPGPIDSAGHGISFTGNLDWTRPIIDLVSRFNQYAQRYTSSRDTSESLSSSSPEHDGTLRGKDRRKVKTHLAKHHQRQPHLTWDQAGAPDVSGNMEGLPDLSRPHSDKPSQLRLPSFWLGTAIGSIPRRFLPASPASPPRPGRRTPPSAHTILANTLLAPLFLCLLAAPLPVSAQRHIPPALLHIAAGTSFATSATIPPLRGNDVPAPWWITMYGVWGVAFTGFLVAELLVRPTWAQRRLLAGLLLFSGLNLTGSLVQGGDSILDGMASWGPLAMTASLWLVPVLMEVWGVRRAGRRAEGAVQAVELVGIM